MVIETANTSAHQAEPEYFDPASVPLVKWSDYEASRKDSSSNSDTKSKMSYGTGYGYTNSVAPSNYSESVVGSSFVVGNDYVAPAGFPSDEELLQEIRHILSTTDLMKITKKSVRDQLSRLFGIDVTPRKEYIHYCIDGVLKGEL
jgi:chitin synthase